MAANSRIPRKKGQPANSKKHSDLYTDENPKGTIHGLGFKDVATAKASVSKIRKSSRSHAHKIQAAVAMEQRAREMGKTAEAAIYRKFINSMKKKTQKMNEGKSHGDHEHEMIRRQTSSLMNAAKRIKKKVGKGEGDVKAWVQSKITKAADYIDTAADYMDSKDVKEAANAAQQAAIAIDMKKKGKKPKSMNEGSLHKWFKGSKSKDGKGGWVNVVTGGTCASDEPGEGTPKCVSSAKRARMSKKERLSAARRKKKADPNQQSKTGAAKPTYVRTDKKKKVQEENINEALPAFVAGALKFGGAALKSKAGLKFIGGLGMGAGKALPYIVAPKTMLGIHGLGLAQQVARKSAADKENENIKLSRGVYENHYGSAVNKIPKELDKSVAMHASQAKRLRASDEFKKDAGETANKIPGQLDKAVAMHKKQAKQLRAAGVDDKNCGCGQTPCKTYGKKKMKEELSNSRPNLNEKCWKGYKKKGMKTMFGKRYPNCVKESDLQLIWEKARKKSENKTVKRWWDDDGDGIGYEKGEVKEGYGKKKKKKMKEEVDTVSEAKDKKGKGSGTKDACYHKVKSRYSVWPSAYASGALVKCRKVGAANWGNKSESVEYQVDEGLGKVAMKVAKTVGKKLGKTKYQVGLGIERVKEKPAGALLAGGLLAGKVVKDTRDRAADHLDKKKKNKMEHYSWIDDFEFVKEGAAWTKKEGKNKSGGLNEKGRKSYERENPGSDLKRPSKKVGNKRRASFCARMKGMKKKLTSKKTANDPDSRINKSLRAWNC